MRNNLNVRKTGKQTISPLARQIPYTVRCILKMYCSKPTVVCENVLLFQVEIAQRCSLLLSRRFYANDFENVPFSRYLDRMSLS